MLHLRCLTGSEYPSELSYLLWYLFIKLLFPSIFVAFGITKKIQKKGRYVAILSGDFLKVRLELTKIVVLVNFKHLNRFSAFTLKRISLEYRH